MYRNDSQFPKNAESLKIVIMQAAIAWGIFLSLYGIAKMFRVPLRPEMSLIGLFVGALLYGLQREKKFPDSLAEMDHSLAMRVMLLQTSIAVALIWGYAFMKGWISLPMETAYRERIFVLTGITLGSCAPISYVLTRIGLRTAIRKRMQARASGA